MNRSRRQLLRAGLGLAATTLAAGTAAGVTPDQVEGPFFPKRKRADVDADLTRVEGRDAQARGEVIVVSGCIMNEDGQPLTNALIDVWQANSYGRYDHEDDPSKEPLDPNFQSWAQLKTGEDGRYRFRTVVPGAYRASGSWWRPPHIHFKVARRGYRELITQMYFDGHELNGKDLLLQELPESGQRKLLVPFSGDGERQGIFDITLAAV